MADDDLLLAAYWETGDDAVLGVLADVLTTRGDPRGEHLQLCLVEAPTPAQLRRRYQLERELGAQLVGPAARFLRRWSLGPRGFVTHVRCTVAGLIAGFEAIAALHPRLFVSIEEIGEVSSKELGRIPLDRFHYIDFGGTDLELGALDDACLARIAPAFARVRHLGLTVVACDRGRRPSFTPGGLRSFGDRLTALELLYFDHAGERALLAGRIPPCSAYADAIVECRGFQTVKALIMRGAGEAVRRLPNLVTLHIDRLGSAVKPHGWQDIERLKRA